MMRRNGAAPGFSILLVQHTREMCTSCGIVCNAATTGGGLILVLRHGTEPGFPNSSHSSTAKRAHLNVNRPRPRGTNWQTDRHAETVRQTDFPNRPRTFPNWQICRAAQSQNQGKHSVFENGAEPPWEMNRHTGPAADGYMHSVVAAHTQAVFALSILRKPAPVVVDLPIWLLADKGVARAPYVL